MFRVIQTKLSSQCIFESGLLSRVSAYIERAFENFDNNHTPKLATVAISTEQIRCEDVADTMRRRRRGRYGIAQVSDIKTTWY